MGVAAAAAVNVVCAVLVGRIRREGDIRGPRRRVEHSLRDELLGGVRTLPRAGARRIVLLFNSQTMVRGPVECAPGRRFDRAARNGRRRRRLAERRARGRRPRRRTRRGRARRQATSGGSLRSRARALGSAHRAHRPGRGRDGLQCLGIVGIGNALLDVSGYTCSIARWTSTCSVACSASSRSVSP